jgi:hypothetical protein
MMKKNGGGGIYTSDQGNSTEVHEPYDTYFIAKMNV